MNKNLSAECGKLPVTGCLPHYIRQLKYSLQFFHHNFHNYKINNHSNRSNNYFG